MLGGEPDFHNRPQEKFMTHRSSRKCPPCQGEVKAGCRQRERDDLGHMPLSRFFIGVFWGPRLSLGWSIEPKQEGLGKPC